MMLKGRTLALAAAGLVVLGAAGAAIALYAAPAIAPKPTAEQRESYKATPISIDEAKARDGALYVDVRGADSYAFEHIAGAISLYERMVLTQRDPQLPRDKDLILYCACPHEESAIAAAHQMYGKYGYDRVFVLTGGIQGWKAAQLPTARSVVQ